jgi:hypothetical protein
MHPRDRLLGAAKLCLAHDKAVPLDTLAMADEYGLLLTEFGEMPSHHNHNNNTGEALYGSKTTETDFHDL